MLIVCPQCATSYRVTPESLGESGRSVRCVKCHAVWFEQPREPAGRAGDRDASEGIDPALIRPPLNDVVDIGALEADSEGNGAGVEIPPEHHVAARSAGEDFSPQTVPGAVPAADVAREPPNVDAQNNIERIAAARFGKRPTARRRVTLSQHALPAAICALMLVIVCLIAARQQVVRFLPQTASLYARIGLPVNLRGLAFENVRTAREEQDGVPMLVVEGEIVGTTGRHTEVPRLRFAVVDGGGKEIYAWTARPARTLLPPGETLPFRSRLASPPAEAKAISVRFFNRRDAEAGFM
jgi:predicted Zn finger-like uncharacterized protein